MMHICSLESWGRSLILNPLHGVIAENKEKYTSFNINVIVDLFKDMWGKIKKKKIQLRFT